MADFLERFVGVRWYWPVKYDGRSVVKTRYLAVPPAHYRDAPVFLKRVYSSRWEENRLGSRWFDKTQPEQPALVKALDPKEKIERPLVFLRGGRSWPYQISVHMPQGFKYWKSPEWFTEHEAMFADESGLDVATYIQLYNAAGFLMQVEVDWVHRIIWKAKHPVITIKPMAAGRLLPLVGLGFSWATLRDCDMVTVGTMSPDEAKEDIEISLSILERRGDRVELQSTRSKKSLTGR